MKERYSTSEIFLDRAIKIIPLGSQTFSKSKVSFPQGASPYFLKNGVGSHVWDVDGNEYIDYISGLLSLSLGYKDVDVDDAVKKQLENGITFSLPHSLEIDVAEKIIDMVPCAEMVRFGKNGSDATAGAIRLARAYTGRDHVAVCGYHGWQDWYIGSTPMDLGVPEAIKKLTHKFIYNDVTSLDELFRKFPQQISAVILEPMTFFYPEDGFLEKVKEITHKHGALLVFDEMITGFRFANGGAQEYFGVTPDLAAFGKGMANGYPISAIVGRRDIMQLMEKIFFSFTFGGETISLAAALATMNKIEYCNVVEKIAHQGEKVITGTRDLISKYDMSTMLSIAGHPSWSMIIINECGSNSMLEIKTLFMQEMLSRGILTFGTHNMSYSHSDEDIFRLLAAYNEVFPLMKDVVENSKMSDFLRCKSLEPLFKVR